jgi:hypothetical protein
MVLFTAAVFLFLGFFGVSSVGYILWFVTHQRRSGKAWDCVRYFYCIVGGVGITGFAVAWGEHLPHRTQHLRFGKTGLAV